MATSPFVFMRGAAQLFYADRANGTLALPDELYRRPRSRVCGSFIVSPFRDRTSPGQKNV
jgi:uncharacterized protein (DUF2252 family)